MAISHDLSTTETFDQLALTGYVVLDEHGAVKAANDFACKTLIGERAEGRSFRELVSDSVKFGRVSKSSAATILAGIDKGSTTFRIPDGRTFFLRTLTTAADKRIEWIDISTALSDLNDRDHATGLLTRQGFAAAVEEIKSEPSSSVVFLLELDNVLDAVDQFGYSVGEALMRRVGERVASQLGDAARNLARGTGGDFLFIAPAEKSPALAEALLDVLGRPYLIGGKMIHSTVSIGLAPIDGSGAEPVLHHANLALRKAKSSGGNQACRFSHELALAIQRKRLLEGELRKALALREFSLVYQPQYQIEGNRLVGFEALLRWNHPEQGSVSPAEFIPLAEELGLILPIGEWVLRTACHKAAGWPATISISVNVSPLQFRSPTIVSTVKGALQDFRLDPGRLDLEVTEGAVLLNSAAIMETFRQLKAIGVRFSMDDFGTGYSSLSYLQKFPFDKIKIDQSFVKSLSSSRDSRAIIRTICALGKSLGLTTIAEGVETSDQLAQIEKKGCQQVQGYLTGRPLLPQMADELVAAQA